MCSTIQCSISCDSLNQSLKLLSFKVHKIIFLLKFTSDFYIYAILNVFGNSNNQIKLCLKDLGRKKSILQAKQNGTGYLCSEAFSLLNFVDHSVPTFIITYILLHAAVYCTIVFLPYPSLLACFLCAILFASFDIFILYFHAIYI